MLEVLVVPKGTAPTWSNNGIAIFSFSWFYLGNFKTFCSQATSTSDRNGWWVETELNQEVRSRALSVIVHALPSPSLASHVITPPLQFLFNGKSLSVSREKEKLRRFSVHRTTCYLMSDNLDEVFLFFVSFAVVLILGVTTRRRWVEIERYLICDKKAKQREFSRTIIDYEKIVLLLICWTSCVHTNKARRLD